MSDTDITSRSLHVGLAAWFGGTLANAVSPNAAAGYAGDSPHGTPADVAKSQKQLAALQWAIPAVTGALVVVSSVAGEQQRPAAVLPGVRDRLTN